MNKKDDKCIFPNNPEKTCKNSECCNIHSSACCLACINLEHCRELCMFIAERRLAQAEAERQRLKGTGRRK